MHWKLIVPHKQNSKIVAKRNFHSETWFCWESSNLLENENGTQTATVLHNQDGKLSESYYWYNIHHLCDYYRVDARRCKHKQKKSLIMFILTERIYCERNHWVQRNNKCDFVAFDATQHEANSSSCVAQTCLHWKVSVSSWLEVKRGESLRAARNRWNEHMENELWVAVLAWFPLNEIEPTKQKHIKVSPMCRWAFGYDVQLMVYRRCV